MAKYEMGKNVEDIRATVPCSDGCGAPVGKKCVAANGKDVQYIHTPRMRAYANHDDEKPEAKTDPAPAVVNRRPKAAIQAVPDDTARLRFVRSVLDTLVQFEMIKLHHEYSPSHSREQFKLQAYSRVLDLVSRYMVETGADIKIILTGDK